ncbi:hypothetical protein BGZ81_011121 [Podila clonocystis]|nr:hypothetical protein BGZ81_011121 [Podila clonocystis]
MPSVYPVPRCVLAQTFLDNMNNRSSSESSNGSSSDEDRNTDVDEKHQQSPNRLQGRQQDYRHVHHLHHNPQHRQHQYAQQYHRRQHQQTQHRDGVTDLPLPSSLVLASGGLATTVEGGGTGDCNEAPHPAPGISSNTNYAQERQNYHHSQQHKMHDQQSYPYRRSGTNQHLGSSPSHSGNSMPSQMQQYQQQQQQRNMCYPRSSSVSSSSVPGSGAYQHPPPQQQQNNHYSSHAHAHAQMNRLEVMFPPLHDNDEDIGVNLEHKPSQRPDHPTLDQMLNTLKATTAPKPSDRVGGPSSQSANNTVERQLSRRCAPPPPLLIPASVVQTTSDKTDKRVSTVVPSLPSPESPSGLAIHLYVHHHHHHHSQEAVENKSGALSPSLLLLSPLTVEPSSTTTANTTLPPLLPSPVSPPLTTPQLVSLLPSANIPSLKDSISSSSATPLSSTNTKPLTPTEEDAPQAPLPWFNHPNSLANSSSSRPSRPIRLHQPRVRLPDPATSAHLLSTISQQDLSRLYVHAAHHLHSHQPIRRYVLMKMLMTQAELTQYGRLRAEMPRAPGPSTGALPKRTEFGTVENTGLGARCKVSSGLGRFVVTRKREEKEEEKEEKRRKRVQERVGVEEEEGEGKMNKSKKMSWSMPSFSLSALTGGRTAQHPKLVSLSERETHPLLPAAVIDEKDACRDSSSMQKDAHHRRKQVKRQDSGCYASSRRLEELELGGGGDRLQTRRRSLTRSLSMSSSSDYEMEDMDDDDDECVHEMEEIQLDRSIRQQDLSIEEEEQGEEGEADDYWTMLRQKNNRSRRRWIRMEDASVPEDKEDTSMYHYQHPSSQHQQQPSRHHHQQQPLQHQHLDQNAIQPSPPNLHHYQHNQRPQSISSSTSFLSPPASGSPKTLVRPPTKISISPSKSLNRVSNTHHRTQGRESRQTLPIMGAMAESGNGSSDTIGLSTGLLMVSLLFGFLYLIEGTNQFHNLQSALLSIIL